MSFVERNKAWLLPVLGLAAGAVIYMNYRVMSGTPAPPEVAPVPTTEPALAPSAPPSAAVPAGEGGAGIWDDLRRFAVVPGSLPTERGLRDQARRALDTALKPCGMAQLPLIARPAELPSPPQSGGGEVLAAPTAPELEFLIHGPAGPRAWFQGESYRPGQALRGQPFVVDAIGRSKVELKGPKGRTTRSTIPPLDAPPSREAAPTEDP